MKSTLKTGLFSAMTALGTVALLTSANAAGFGELDANTDGQLDLAELQASFGENAQSTLDAYDTDADGMISVEEAEAMAAQSGAAATADAAATGEAAATTEAPAAEAGAPTTAPAATGETTIAPGTEAEASATTTTELPATTAVTEGAEAGAAAIEGAADDAAATIDDTIRSNASSTVESETN